MASAMTSPVHQGCFVTVCLFVLPLLCFRWTNASVVPVAAFAGMPDAVLDVGAFTHQQMIAHTVQQHSTLQEQRIRRHPPPPSVNVTSVPNAVSVLQLLAIRNISLVLDNLLEDYDRTQRPEHGGTPTVISTNILVKSMGPISELEMTYQMDCYFRQSWIDKRLRFDGPVETLSLNMKMLEGIWKPDTYFHNGQQSYVHTLTRPNKFLRIFKDGQVLYSTRLTIKAKCPMQLRNFPMDKQSCPLVLGSYAYALDEVRYQWDSDKGIGMDSSMALSQFDLVGSPHRNMTVKMRRGIFSTLQVNFKLKRHAGYFLIQVYVPCVLIVIISWVSFWINREATADRIGLGITTVLTLSTFGIDNKNDLPKVHYATALDWFVILCFSFVIASLLEFAGVHFFTKVGSGETLQNDDDDEESGFEDSDWEDVETRETNGVLSVNERPLVLTNKTEAPRKTTTTQPTSPSDHGRTMAASDDDDGHDDSSPAWTENRNCCVQFAYCVLGNDTYRVHLRRQTDGVNSVSKIDRAARFLFPATFLILNFLYWICYTSDVGTDNWMTSAL